MPSGSTTPNDAVMGTVKSITNGKVITYRYTKRNGLGVGVLVSIVASGTGVPVQCFVVGI